MAERLILTGGDIIQGESILPGYALVIEGSTIKEVVPLANVVPTIDDRVIFCDGGIICPGFIDIHNQGGGGFSVLDASDESIDGLAQAHGDHGTTGLLLTPPVFKNGFESLLPELARHVGRNTGGAGILGIHAEGPFINTAKQGCMPDDGFMAPDMDILGRILDSADGKIVEMTIAPELPGALDLIAELARRDVVPSLGHSDATLTDVLRAIDNGASHVTHYFNCISPIHHREPGLAGAALYSSDLSVELIADGFHVHPWMLGLTVHVKKPSHTCLITDAMSVAGLPDGEYVSLGQKVRLSEGRLALADHPETLAGSVLTMDRAVNNMVRMTGMELTDVVTMASTTPAAVLGLEHRKGLLSSGYDADIAVLDRSYMNVLTIVGGKIVYNALEK